MCSKLRTIAIRNASRTIKAIPVAAHTTMLATSNDIMPFMLFSPYPFSTDMEILTGSKTRCKRIVPNSAAGVSNGAVWQQKRPHIFFNTGSHTLILLT